MTRLPLIVSFASGMVLLLIALLAAEGLSGVAADVSLAMAWVALLLSVGAAVRGSVGPAYLVCFSFVFAYFSLPLVAQLSTREFPLPGTDYADGDFWIASTLAVLVIVGLSTGYLSLNAPRSDWLPAATVSSRRLAALGVFLLLIAAALAARGGPTIFFSSRAEFGALLAPGTSTASRQFLEGSGPLEGITRALVHTGSATLAVVWFAFSRAGEVRGPYQRLASLAAIAPAVLLANPIIAPRYVSLGLLSALGVLTVPLPRRGAAARLVPLAVLVALLLVPRADSFRREERVDQSRLSLAAALVEEQDFSQSQQLVNAAAHVSSHGHAFGLQTLGSVLVFVPRSIWTGKPGDTGRLILQGDVVLNPSASPFVEGYVDFGLGGALVAALAVGRAVRWADLRLSAEGARARSLGALLVGVLPLLLRGSMQTFVQNGLLALAVLYLLGVLSGASLRPRRRAIDAVRPTGGSGRAAIGTGASRLGTMRR